MTNQDVITKAVIEGYRNLIEARYSYENISANYDLPSSFDATRLAQYRGYFLDYLYPSPAKRAELNAAFDSLDNYIKEPSKLLRLLLDSTRLLFKYGRHLPKILTAGIKALRSFRSGTQIEQKLVKIAENAAFEPPYSIAQMNTLLGSMSRATIEDFITQNEALFEVLYDQKLVKKILEIVEYLIAKMQERPTVYAAEEINGLVIGRDIIRAGNALFTALSKEEQAVAFNLILSVERSVLDDLFA